MANSLQNLFHALATAKNEHQLRMRFMDNISEHFGVQRWGIYMFNENNSYSAVEVRGMPNLQNFIELYAQVGRKKYLRVQKW